MRDRWRPLVAVLGVVIAAGILAAVAWAAPAISITSLQARAGSTPITSGPMGAGYDIRIAATVMDTTWRSTRWTIGGVPRCVDHSNQSAGNRTVTLAYEFERNSLLKEGTLPDPDKVGPGEHVFPPPPGGTSALRVELFNNDSCSGSPLATQQLALTTKVPGANELLAAACQGMKVAVILDESGSIATAGATQEVKDATRALATGLVDTGARMAVFKFSTTASSSFIAPYQTVTQSFINGALDDYLDAYRPDNATNWDAGLTQARNQTLSDQPDLVIFLTDGNPNRLGNGGTGYEEGHYTPLNAAAGVADLLKQNSHMFVIGVGVGVTDALSALRIESVSGTKSFPQYPIALADYTLVTDFSELEEALEEIASNLCNVTVTVKKETDELVRDAWVSKSGWGFSGRVVQQPPASQFSYAWFEPARVDPVTTTSATQSGTTGADGTLRFVWRPKAATSLSNITVSETVPPAYTARSVSCVSGGTTIFSSEVPATVTSFTLPGLKVRDRVDCVVRNRVKRSTVRVVKNWVGAPASATIFVDQNGAAPYDASTVAAASGASASFDYPVSTPVRVGETTVPAGYSATIDCGQGPQAYNGGPYPVTAPAGDGATLTCTVTNTQHRSTVRVVKRWVGAPASATIYVDQNGTAPFDASTVATTDGANASFTYPLSTAVTVGEVAVPAGYSATIDCGDGVVPYGGGPYAVNAPDFPNATLTCIVTNQQQFSTVQIVKQWDGAPASATIFVDQDGVAPYDAQTIATADGDSTSFDYPVSTPVNVGEVTVPSGYSATIDCGQGPQPYTGGAFPVTAPAGDGATLTCTVTNTQEFSTVQIVKQWAGAPASATIFVDQDGVAPYDAETIATADGDLAFFDYPVSTPVNVGEVTVPSGYSATIDCGQGPQPYTGGAFPVTAPAGDGATLTCTVTNIIVPPLLATVQVVKQWDGAPASATIFVDQDGIAPYDAQTVATADGDIASFDYVVSTPVNVGEVTVPSGYSATIDCGQGPQPYTGGAFPVTAPAGDGATLTCTVTNTQLFSSVRVVKQWVGAPSSATIFVDQDGVAPYDSQTVATADGDSTSFVYPVSTSVNVGEVAVPAGYRAVIHCGLTREAPQPYGGGPFPVVAPDTGGGTLTCTITNIQLRSTVQVVKDWAGGSSSAAIFVDQDGVAPYDASISATASGDSTSFTYPVSTPVTLGETAVPTGFRAEIDCGAGPQPYAGGPFAVTSPATAGTTLTCTVINTPTTTVRLIKSWAGRPDSATIFVDKLGQAPLDTFGVATTDGQSVSHDYPPSTQTTLGEIAVPTGYVAFINCGNGPQDLRRYTGGPLSITSPSTPGGVLTCTLTNARRPSPGRLVIAKKASRNVIRPPGRVTFTVTVRNRGPGTARAVIMCDNLPPGLILVKAPGSRRVNGRLCWRIGRLGPGKKRSFVVVTRVARVDHRVVFENVAIVEGGNTVNCPLRVVASKRQRAACSRRARVVALPRRLGLRGVRITFTG